MKTTLEIFNDFPANARTWVYQSSRTLTDEEAKELTHLARGFTKNWLSHGAQLPAASDVLYNRFLIMMVDESAETAGGCSIDSSVIQIRSIQQKLNIDLLDRMDLAFLNTEGTLETVHANKIFDAYEHGVLTEDTTVFNNIITSKAELETNWRVPLKKSWAGSRVKTYS